jgi:glycosyltransferase involved in cell wall biosynthesis
VKFGTVAIGRNEGERLRKCLESLSAADFVVYVDSGSTDDSVQCARHHGADVVELDPKIPFTAARARNAGFAQLRKMAPDLVYVQFVDGDCQLAESWPREAISFLEKHEQAGVVFGRRRERHPEQSIYNWMCDQEWNVPVGEVRACGGDVMMRVQALRMVGGYRDDLIAGEEPELCVRLRAAGWRIWRLDGEMTLHDAAMTRLSQWWRRTIRGGYGLAQGAYLHGAAPERHWVWESCRAWIWGVWLPLACLASGLVLGPSGWAAWLIYPLQMLRQTWRNPGRPRERLTLAAFQLLARFPEVWGQIRFMRDRLLGRIPRIIEYK